MRFSGSLSTCFSSLSRPHAQPRWSPWKNASTFSKAQSDNKKWCKAPLIFKTMDGLVPGHPSVAQVWSLWLALMRFAWERRGFPPFLLEVFNDYIYYTIYIISKQGCKRNSPIHCAMVRFLTVIQRECFALLTIPHAIFSQRPCTQAGPLQYIRCQPLFVGILWIYFEYSHHLSPSLWLLLNGWWLMLVEDSQYGNQQQGCLNTERIPSNLCGQTHSCMSGKEQNKQGTLIWSLILSTQLTRQNKILAHGCHGRPSPQDFPIR